MEEEEAGCDECCSPLTECVCSEEKVCHICKDVEDVHYENWTECCRCERPKCHECSVGGDLCITCKEREWMGSLIDAIKEKEKLEEIQKAINLKSPDTLPVIDDIFDFLSTYHSENLQKFLALSG